MPRVPRVEAPESPRPDTTPAARGARRRPSGPVLVLAGIVGLALSVSEARADFRFGFAAWDGDFESAEGPRLVQVPFAWVLSKPTSRLTITATYARIEQAGNVTLTADGPAILGAGGAGRPPWQSSPPGADADGTGDIFITEELLLSRGGKGRRPFLALVFDLKIPTADEKKGLGTGERDWGVGLSYVQPVSKSWQILGEAGYRFMGDPEGVDFEDRRRLAAGIAAFAGRVQWRLIAEEITPLLDTVPFFNALGVPIGTLDVEPRRIGRLDLTVRSHAGGSTRIGVTGGLNDGAEDFGFYLELSSGGR